MYAVRDPMSVDRAHHGTRPSPTSYHLLAVALACSTLHGIIVLFTIVSGPWYGYKISGAENKTKGLVEYGTSPFMNCTRLESDVVANVPMRCYFTTGSLPHYGESEAVCDRTEADLKNRLLIVRIFAPLTGLWAFITAFSVLIILANVNNFKTCGGCCFLWPFLHAILTICIAVVAIIMSIHFYLHYSTCGIKVCSLLKLESSESCKEIFFYQAWIFWISTVLSVIAFIFTLISCCCVRRDIDSDHQYEYALTTRENALPARSPNASPRIATPSQVYTPRNAGRSIPIMTQRVNERPALPPSDFVPPEGEWVWDPKSRMYWCEEQYLFVNPVDGHFYDPNSNHWYNPNTEKWYAPEDAAANL